MRMKLNAKSANLCVLAVLVVALSASSSVAQERARRAATKGYPPKMSQATASVYKTVGDVSLNMYIFNPEDHQIDQRRPAIVFFFGGGWRGGSPKQFEKHCLYLASRDMVAMAADYRVSSRHGVKAMQCVADAKSAIRWVRANAAKLGVDPERIVASGGSAGGHLAACTGVIEGFDEPGESTSVSSRPNAMILFNPAVVVAPIDGDDTLAIRKGYRDRMGTDPIRLSPYHQVKGAVPPTVIFHGRDDKTVLYRSVEYFTKVMKEMNNPCKLVGYDGEGHGFFNYGRKKNRYFTATMAEADRFLVSLEYLEGEPTIEQFDPGKTQR